MHLQPEDIERFRITDLDFDASTSTVVLRYALDHAVTFEERIELAAEGPSPLRRTREEDGGLAAVLRLLHLAAGVSYYKAAAPTRIVVESAPLTDGEARLCRGLYDHGLREFAYRNGLAVPRPIELESDAPTGRSGPGCVATAAPPPGIGIPIGGGKDSIVVVDALRDRHPLLVSVNGHAAARRVAEVAGLDLVVVRRTLDPALLELNRSGALNGHVPITAIVSLITVAAGYVHGFDTTVMALESSADDPTRTTPTDAVATTIEDAVATPGDDVAGTSTDGSVNHQWSKSRAFEVLLRDTLHRGVHPEVNYLSALRDVTDLQIAATFARLTGYHHAFRSCNRSFGLGGGFDGWCRDCPKCRFVFLTLATAMDRAQLVGIFGGDMLADPSQVAGFEDLLEEGRKPFECVGTRHESLVAFRRLAADPRWAGSEIVDRLRPVIAGMEPTDDPGPDDPGAATAAARRAVDATFAPSLP
jgi:UDP-N-acetyl-alpha-D-muramoyl-L-alanyl-L-glutamate epimerase